MDCADSVVPRICRSSGEDFVCGEDDSIGDEINRVSKNFEVSEEAETVSTSRSKSSEHFEVKYSTSQQYSASSAQNSEVSRKF